jgi:predicted nuclease with TOPRIM domain
MTKTLEKIQQEERQLVKELNQIESDTTQLQHMTEKYEAVFYQTSTLFTKMADQFSQNEFHWYISEQTVQLHQHQRTIFNELADEQHQRRKQKILLEDRQNDLFYQRKALLVNQEEPTNEY